MRISAKFGLWVLVLGACFQSVALAHGLLARVRASGDTLVGTAYYSSGDAAGGEWVEVFDVTNGGGKVAEFAADADGGFRYTGTPGHRYRILVNGDEGHSIELEISLAKGARADLVEREAAETASVLDAPAWAVVGGALLLVTLAAAPYRLRQRKRILGPRYWT